MNLINSYDDDDDDDAVFDEDDDGDDSDDSDVVDDDDGNDHDADNVDGDGDDHDDFTYCTCNCCNAGLPPSSTSCPRGQLCTASNLPELRVQEGGRAVQQMLNWGCW